MRKILSIILLLAILLTSQPLPAFAQAEDDASSAALPETPASLEEGENATSSGDISEILEQTTLGRFKDPSSEASALIRPPVRIRSLARKTYRATESVTVVVDDAKLEEIKTIIYNVDGVQVPAKVQVISDTSPVTLKISPRRNFKPGRYRVTVEVPGAATSSQEFSWGVLAINMNKSIYSPQETAKIFLAVLDETGSMVCDADVTLRISDPAGVAQTMTTKDGNIKVNPACEQKAFTMESDYETRYTTSGAGTYDVRLSATTKNGTYSIQDAFLVSDNVPFDVERTTTTRVYPPAVYPAVFTIMAKQDFDGVVQEIVPDNFDIAHLDGIQGFDEVSTVSAALSETTTLEAPIFDIGLPFKERHVFTQGFGGIHRDPFLLSKYRKFGILGHDGVDFAMQMGTEVIAVDAGTIGIARANADYGTTIGIVHPWGKSYYGHLSKLLVEEGEKVQKGQLIGLSGNTGLSTAPHLHFGIKPFNADMDNGYFGKINPLPYLRMFTEDRLNPETITLASNNGAVKILKWHVSLKKGDTVQLGYQYQTPPESPQFYLLGPLEFRAKTVQSSEVATVASPPQEAIESLVFQEARKWQLAIDADGSGTNVVSPTTGTISTTGNTYAFTYTSGESVATGSGGIKISVPGGVGWSTPQGTAGVAGYTTAVGNSTATVGTVLNTNDVVTGWTEDDTDMCNTFGVSTLTPMQGSSSILCDNNPTSAGPDSGDAFSFDFGANQNWTTACNGGACTQVSYWIRRINGTSGTAADFAWGSGTDLGTSVIAGCAVPATPASGVWYYATCTLSGTLTTVRTYGIRCTNATCNPVETGDVYIDEILIGPGVPTFSGNDIEARILDIANAETLTVTYGAGGGSSGVTNASTEGVHTFTTQSKISVKGTYTSISSSPTVTLSSGPTLDQLLRHGAWFSNGVEQPFTW